MVKEGEELWRPDEASVASSHLKAFEAWLEAELGLTFPDYEALWRWSVSDLEGFWAAVWRYFNVESSTPYRAVLSGEEFLGARWFEGSQVNYAEHILRRENDAPERPVLLHATEEAPLAEISWAELGRRVRILAEQLRAMGVSPGDRVVSYMPNVPETAIAMLAVTAIGGVWAAASPEFGSRVVVDRFEQISPKVALVTDGYIFGGKRFDRRRQIAEICRGLPSLTDIIWFSSLGEAAPSIDGIQAHRFDDLMTGADPGREAFQYERVPFDHPLWILFSSGTTGKPKAIVHSHVGTIAEQLKWHHLHTNLKPDSRLFFYTTTGWMVFNMIVSSLMTGCSIVLYDGSPAHGGVDCLWRLVEKSGATVLGASPTLVQQMQSNGICPRDSFDVGRLEMIFLGGSPSTPETFKWCYTDVKDDLWVCSMSGGTDICSSFVGGIPGRPVYAGEIQGRLLGMDVHAWDAEGHDLIDETGELVVTKPFPSAPIRFWGDDDNTRLRESYFSVWPGVWRHGDLLKVNARGGCYIYGRSDATLNRFGVRIGTGEIYGVLANVPGVNDSLVVCCEMPGGGYYMPLFVSLEPGRELDEALRSKIREALSVEASPRHVPDEIWQVEKIPYTLTGKKMEVPIRRLLMGAELAAVALPDAMADPDALDWYAAFARRRENEKKRTGWWAGN